MTSVKASVPSRNENAATSDKFQDEAAVWNAKALQDKVINAAGLMRGEVWSPRLETKRIVSEVAAKYGVTLTEVMGRIKTQRVTAARSAAIAAIHKAHPDWTYIKIAKAFGLNHSTVVIALQRKGIWKPRKEGPEKLRKQAALEQKSVC